MNSSKTPTPTIFIRLRPYLRLDIIGFIATILLFIIWPKLDLVVAQNYYSGGRFIYADNGFIRFTYLVFAKIHIVYLLLFIAGIIYCAIRKYICARKYWAFLLFALLIGPGLLVNVVLKDNSVGRPRPQHIVQFGGDMTFTPVFHFSGECKKNCSFVSGHAAMGFFLMAIAWVRQRRVWFFYGITLGAIVGFGRILQGGHFLSDILFAGWFTYFTYFALATLMKIPYPNKN